MRRKIVPGVAFRFEFFLSGLCYLGPMHQANTTLPGVLLLFKDILPASALSEAFMYPVLLAAVFVAQLLRYFSISGGVFWLVWKFFKQRNSPHKLDPRPLDNAQLRREIGWSLCTAVMFSFVAISIVWLRRAGYTSIYANVSDHGVPYLILSVICMLMMHDVYFYIIHRAMHTQLMYRTFHKVHHQSIDPTPFASFTFHPLEAALESGIIYVCIFAMPLHPYAMLSFQTASFLINVYGHLGYEFSQHRTTVYSVWNPIRYINRTSHHHDHHKRGGGCNSGNFGLYTTVWDHLFSTLLPAAPLPKLKD